MTTGRINQVSIVTAARPRSIVANFTLPCCWQKHEGVFNLMPLTNQLHHSFDCTVQLALGRFNRCETSITTCTRQTAFIHTTVLLFPFTAHAKVGDLWQSRLCKNSDRWKLQRTAGSKEPNATLHSPKLLKYTITLSSSNLPHSTLLTVQRTARLRSKLQQPIFPFTSCGRCPFINPPLQQLPAHAPKRCNKLHTKPLLELGSTALDTTFWSGHHGSRFAFEKVRFRPA